MHGLEQLVARDYWSMSTRLLGIMPRFRALKQILGLDITHIEVRNSMFEVSALRDPDCVRHRAQHCRSVGWIPARFPGQAKGVFAVDYSGSFDVDDFIDIEKEYVWLAICGVEDVGFFEVGGIGVDGTVYHEAEFEDLFAELSGKTHEWRRHLAWFFWLLEGSVISGNFSAIISVGN